MNTETSAEVSDAAAEQAAAEASFANMRGGDVTEPVEIDAPEQSAEEIAAEKVSEAERIKADEDAWLKGIPQSVRESLTAMQGVSGRLRNVEGHIGGLTSVTKELRTAMTAAKSAAVQAGGDAPTDAQVAAANTSEKWKQMKEDFPEFADAMEERLSGYRSPTVDVDGITKKVTESFTPALADAEMRARQFARVDMTFEDWEDTVKTPEFTTWFKSQPEETQALAGSVYAKDAIKLLSTYHGKDKPAEMPAKVDHKARLAAAVTPTKGSPAPARAEQTEQQAAEAAWKRVRGG